MIITHLIHTIILLQFIVVFMLTACATTDEADLPAKSYFDKAMSAISEDNHDIAIEELIKLNNRHPFSVYSEQALLELSYLYFQNDKLVEAKATLDRFLRQYNTSTQIDYVYYLRAMTLFNLDRNFLQDYTSTNSALRDLTNSAVAYRDFQFLVENYPTSRFAIDSRNHMAYIRNQLAQKEVLIGAQYLENEAWVAAANRGTYVLENFVDSSEYVAQALEIMVVAYNNMGLTLQAEKATTMLEKSFPKYVSKYK